MDYTQVFFLTSSERIDNMFSYVFNVFMKTKERKYYYSVFYLS